MGLETKVQVLAGIDWLTATCQDDRAGMEWFRIFLQASKADGANGKLADDWSAFGYQGRKCDGARWGYNARNGYIIIAHSETAEDIWRAIVPTAAKVTRFDIRVDAYCPVDVSGLPQKHFEVLKDNTARKYAVVQSSGNGNTLYVGSRQSEQFGRLYDKGAQQGEAPHRVWRYEVQINKPRSHALARDVYQKVQLEPVRSWDNIIGYVYQWFDARGVKPIFSSHPTTVEVESSYRVTTADRKLGWLRSQVSPTVEKLIKAGLGEETLKALGLEEQMGLGF